MVKNFYFYRHGQSSYNLDGKIQGHANNSVLTEKGIEQAYSIGHILKSKKIELIVSSPLRRARQTGMIISKLLRSPIHFDDKLTEANLGVIEGMNIEKAKAAFSELYNKWITEDPSLLDIAFEQGESKKEVRKRVFDSLNKYIESPYKNIAISGHGTIMAQALHALGIHKTNVEHGEIIHLQNDNGNWTFLGTVQ